MAWAGVDLFFVLSGFLITSILIRAKSKSAGAFFGTFYLRRFRRIVPFYALFLLVAGLCFTIEWRRVWYWYVFFAANIAESLGRGGGEILTPLWSLAVEEQFYLCWPLLVFLVPLKRLPYSLCFLLVAAPVARGLATPLVHTFLPIYLLTPFRADLLASGALIAWYTHHDPAWPKKHAGKAVMVMAASLGAFAACAFGIPNFRTSANALAFNTAGYTLVLLFCSSLLIACMALPQNRIYRFLTTPVLVYLGKISYMTYLLHQVAITFFDTFFSRTGAVGEDRSRPGSHYLLRRALLGIDGEKTVRPQAIVLFGGRRSRRRV